MTPVRRRVVRAGLVMAAAAVVVVGVLAPPERCPSVDAEQIRSSATETVDWFVRNQNNDGTWLYLYEAESDTAAADYNEIRHSGAIMGLYQAASAGIPGAFETADQGLEWSLDHLFEQDDWVAIRYRGQIAAGGPALLVAGLAERRQDTGDERYDDLLQRMGQFLVAQTEPSGALLAYYDPVQHRPVPGQYSKYYTGEAYWALARLHRLFPKGPWGEAADRIGAYLATERDDREANWPAIPDHWAAYGMAETVAFDERDRDRRLTEDELAYARDQAGSFGAQVRWVSQRFGPWGVLARGPAQPRGGGYGVVGEALGGWWRVSRAEPRLADIEAPLAERARCIAGLAIAKQSDAEEAEDFPDPDRVRGAWFRRGETRMDDQQHALSALLATLDIVENGSAGSSRPAPTLWLWGIVLVAAFNPFRLVLSLPRRAAGPRAAATVAALGGLVGSVGVFVVSLTSGPLLDLLDVSRPALRVAAGAVAALTGALALVRRAPSSEPALEGWRAALVPVAVPLVVSPALVVLALSAHADRGAPVVGAGLAVGTIALAALAARVMPADGVGSQVVAWLARLLTAVLVAGSVLMIVNGVLDV